MVENPGGRHLLGIIENKKVQHKCQAEHPQENENHRLSQCPVPEFGQGGAA